jgi:hypothetical protein
MSITIKSGTTLDVHLGALFNMDINLAQPGDFSSRTTTFQNDALFAVTPGRVATIKANKDLFGNYYGHVVNHGRIFVDGGILRLDAPIDQSNGRRGGEIDVLDGGVIHIDSSMLAGLLHIQNGTVQLGGQGRMGFIPGSAAEFGFRTAVCLDGTASFDIAGLGALHPQYDFSYVGPATDVAVNYQQHGANQVFHMRFAGHETAMQFTTKGDYLTYHG